MDITSVVIKIVMPTGREAWAGCEVAHIFIMTKHNIHYNKLSRMRGDDLVAHHTRLVATAQQPCAAASSAGDAAGASPALQKTWRLKAPNHKSSLMMKAHSSGWQRPFAMKRSVD